MDVGSCADGREVLKVENWSDMVAHSGALPSFWSERELELLEGALKGLHCWCHNIAMALRPLARWSWGSVSEA